MAQFGRPDGDVTVGVWTTAPLWQSIDEASFSDADFISSNNNTNDSAEVSLSNVTKWLGQEAVVICLDSLGRFGLRPGAHGARV